MTAVIAPPKAAKSKGKAINAVPAVQHHLPGVADIRSWIVSADRKLEAAYDAAECGEAIEVLLDHICHTVMLEPLRIIQRDDLTQFDCKRVYADLFPLLACLQGAIRLAEGSILHHSLEEAFQLLDDAQTELDRPNNDIGALPVDDDAKPGLLKVGPVNDDPERGSFEATAIENNAYAMVSEVVAIIASRAEELASDLVYGAMYLTERAEGFLSDGVDARDIKMCEDASAPLAVAIVVLETAVQATDDVALHGALRLLELAKASLDDALAGVN